MNIINQKDAHDLHRNCFVCGEAQSNPAGLGIEFSDTGNDSVCADFLVENSHQGYVGLLHGGIAGTLLDAAMTHCLLNRNIPALTAELTVRYHHPIYVGSQVKVRGELLQQKRGIFLMSASLVVNNEVAVSAKAKFLQPK